MKNKIKMAEESVPSASTSGSSQEAEEKEEEEEDGGTPDPNSPKTGKMYEIDDFWLISTLHLYNYLNNRFIIYNCYCYHRYYNSVDFYENIFIKKQSYLACIISSEDSRIRHMCFPIMLGSMIDLHIRPLPDLDPDLFGCFIVNGSLKILPNFQTNNLNSMHIYSYKEERCVRWVIKTDKHVCHLYYSNSKSDQVLSEFNEVPNQSSATADDDCFLSLLDLNKEEPKNVRSKKMADKESEKKNWMDFVNEVNPYGCNDVTDDQYIDLFQWLLRDYPHIDDLANKTIITAPMILYRVVTMTKHTKLKQIFESGNLFYVLSKKKHMTLIKDFANMYLNIEGQKHDKIRFMLDLTKRSINRQTRNSKALLYPRDADFFICYLTCKEMKDAGETINFSHYVTITFPINEKIIHREIIQSDAYRSGSLRIVINGYMTNCYVENNIESLVEFKRRIPLITFFRLGTKYLFTYTKGYVLVKYSSKYQIFVSPYEAQNLFPDCFDNYGLFTRFGSFARQLSSSILKTPAPKCTVTINNIRGACNVLNSRFKAQAFLNSIGYNSAIIYQRRGTKEVLTPGVEYSRMTLCSNAINGQNGNSLSAASVNDAKHLPIAREKRIAFEWLKYAERWDIKPRDQSVIDGYFKQIDSNILKSPKSAVPKDSSGYFGVVTSMIDPNVARSNKWYLDFLEINLPIRYLFIENRYSLIMNNDKSEVNLLQHASVRLITNISSYQNFLMETLNDDNITISLYNYTPKLGNVNAGIPEDSKILAPKDLKRKRKYKSGNYSITAPQQSQSKCLKLKSLRRMQNTSMFESIEMMTKCDDYYRLYTEKLYGLITNDSYEDRHTNQLVLYCAFGDVRGGCIEDGIVLDQNFVANAPNKLISVTLAVKFMTYDANNHSSVGDIPEYQTRKRRMSSRTRETHASTSNDSKSSQETTSDKASTKGYPPLIVKYTPINKEIDQCLIFGVVACNQRLLTFKSKNVNIIETNLKTHNYYVIYCIEFTSYSKTIESYYNQVTNTVIIHYRYLRPIGVDMKFCNKHGQKAIVSTVADLSYYKAWTRSGKCVHPQLLYSMQSIIGRMAAGQVHEMLTNADCAFGENGEVVAPMSFVIHSVESSVKSKITAALRIDLMTQQNGFDANMCSGLALMHTMQHSGNYTDSHARLHYLKELFKLNGINFEFL